MKINNKVAVVVGGARGIGRAYCEALLSKGAKVVLADILKELGTQAVSEMGAKHGEDRIAFAYCDNCKDEDISSLFKLTVDTFGLPDIVVHNAAIVHEFEWFKCCNVNILGAIRTTNEAMKYMSKVNGGNGGTIIYTSSLAGLKPYSWGPVYVSTKYALVGLALSWGLPENMVMTGIRFNCICPDTVDTELLKFVTPERTYHSEKNPALEDTVEKLMPAFVAEGLIRLIEGDSVTGKALRVTVQDGYEYAPFPDQPI